MLCGCWGDRQSIQCLMSNEVERSFYNAWLFCPCLANVLASLFPTMFVWALTLRMMILWWEVFSVFIDYEELI